MGSVNWTEAALQDLERIHLYLFHHFNASFILKADETLAWFESQVVLHPKMFPTEEMALPLRKAVLNPFMVLFYRIESENNILVVRVFASRADK